MRKLVYRIIFWLLRQAAKQRRHSKYGGDIRFSHIFFVYDILEKEPHGWSLSETNGNLPEMIDSLIWSRLMEFSDGDISLYSEEEINAHYKWFYERIDAAKEKRIVSIFGKDE